VEKLKHDLAWERNLLKDARATINTQMLKVAKYEWLREQEVMLMTPDGVKYLTGADFDSYVDEQTAPKPINLQEAALNDMTRRFNDALAQSVRMTREVIGGHEADGYIYTTHGRAMFFTPQDYTMEININGNDT